MHNNPLYKSMDSISINNNNYNTLSRDNYNYSKLKNTNEDKIYENLDILKNKVKNKEIILDDWVELIDPETGNILCLSNYKTYPMVAPQFQLELLWIMVYLMDGITR